MFPFWIKKLTNEKKEAESEAYNSLRCLRVWMVLIDERGLVVADQLKLNQHCFWSKGDNSRKLEDSIDYLIVSLDVNRLISMSMTIW